MLTRVAVYRPRPRARRRVCNSAQENTPFGIIRFLILAVCLAAPIASGAGETRLPAIGAHLEQYPVIRADFIQTKRMAALRHPLVTRGRVVFSRRHGVLWQIEQPYRFTYILGRDAIVVIDPDGSRRRLSTRDVPGLAQMSRIFRHLLGADTSALRRYFAAAGGGDAARWDMRLTPRQPQVAQYLKEIDIRGGTFVTAIRIAETGGDLTRIRFLRSQGATALTPAEQAIFGSK